MVPGRLARRTRSFQVLIKDNANSSESALPFANRQVTLMFLLWLPDSNISQADQ